MTATANYAKADRLPKDPPRFLKNDFWREWMTPETKSPEPSKRDLQRQKFAEKLKKFGEKHEQGNIPKGLDLLS